MAFWDRDRRWRTRSAARYVRSIDSDGDAREPVRIRACFRVRGRFIDRSREPCVHERLFGGITTPIVLLGIPFERERNASRFLSRQRDASPFESSQLTFVSLKYAQITLISSRHTRKARNTRLCRFPSHRALRLCRQRLKLGAILLLSIGARVIRDCIKRGTLIIYHSHPCREPEETNGSHRAS